MKKMMIIGLACLSMLANAQWIFENGHWHPLDMSSIGMYMSPYCNTRGRFINRDSTGSRKGVISLSKGGNKGISLSKGGNRKKLSLTTKRTNKKNRNRVK